MGTGYLESEGFPDSNVIPDQSTLVKIPWSIGHARVLVHPYKMDKQPAEASPRLLALKQLDRLKEMG